MTDIIFAHGGTLDKYLGDGLMALFGAPTTTPEDASNALNAAVAMQRRIIGIIRNSEKRAWLRSRRHWFAHWRGHGRLYRFERRSEYTAIGDAVNTASRLESNARGGRYWLAKRLPKPVETAIG